MEHAVQFLLGFITGATVATVCLLIGYRYGFRAGLDRCIELIKERSPPNDL